MEIIRKKPFRINSEPTVVVLLSWVVGDTELNMLRGCVQDIQAGSESSPSHFFQNFHEI